MCNLWLVRQGLAMRFLVTIALLLGTVTSAAAQQPPTYDLEFAELDVFQRTDLTTGTRLVEVIPIANPQPGGPSWEIRDATTHAPFGAAWSESDGSRFEGTDGLVGEFHWFASTIPGGVDPEAAFYIEASGIGHTFTRYLASAVKRVTPPPTSPVKLFITQPKSGATVSGTVWVVLWAEGTSGASNVFTLSADGAQVGTQTTSARGPVTIPWRTTPVGGTPVPNGTHTLTGTVRDAAGKTATASITVIVKN